MVFQKAVGVPLLVRGLNKKWKYIKRLKVLKNN
jgi:hypothetical protein